MGILHSCNSGGGGGGGAIIGDVISSISGGTGGGGGGMTNIGDSINSVSGGSIGGMNGNTISHLMKTCFHTLSHHFSCLTHEINQIFTAMNPMTSKGGLYVLLGLLYSAICATGNLFNTSFLLQNNAPS